MINLGQFLVRLRNSKGSWLPLWKSASWVLEKSDGFYNAKACSGTNATSVKIP